jgi:hypothetical protein
MTVTDLFEFSAPRASVVWPVNKPGQEKRVERSAAKPLSGRKTITIKKEAHVR